MAKKLAEQGGTQHKAKLAFPFAGVVVHLWTEFPLFGDLFLAHCHLLCPILVPIYFRRPKDLSKSKFMKAQGYKVSLNGTVETEDLFLFRMAGTVRLYATVLLTQPLLLRKPHPHGLDQAWTWVAHMLNTQPKSNITATALGEFLEICGNAMSKRFGMQFTNLIELLYNDYLPWIMKVTPAKDLGPLTRLQELVEKARSLGQFPKPVRILSESFWRSHSEYYYIK